MSTVTHSVAGSDDRQPLQRCTSSCQHAAHRTAECNVSWSACFHVRASANSSWPCAQHTKDMQTAKQIRHPITIAPFNRASACAGALSCPHPGKPIADDITAVNAVNAVKWAMVASVASSKTKSRRLSASRPASQKSSRPAGDRQTESCGTELDAPLRAKMVQGVGCPDCRETCCIYTCHGGKRCS